MKWANSAQDSNLRVFAVLSRGDGSESVEGKMATCVGEIIRKTIFVKQIRQQREAEDKIKNATKTLTIPGEQSFEQTSKTYASVKCANPTARFPFYMALPPCPPHLSIHILSKREDLNPPIKE